MNVPPSRKAHLIIATDKAAAFEAGSSYITKLAYASEVSVVAEAPEGSDSMVSVITDNARMFMPMAELVDLDKERARLSGELEKTEGEIKRLMGKLSNEGFLAKAPAAVVETERAKLEKYNATKEALLVAIAKLS
jgi:valyl-tRNA synthetase